MKKENALVKNWKKKFLRPYWPTSQQKKRNQVMQIKFWDIVMQA